MKKRSAPPRPPSSANARDQDRANAFFQFVPSSYLIDYPINGQLPSDNGPLADLVGLKARKIIAQGKASLRATPWVNRPSNYQALKGR